MCLWFCDGPLLSRPGPLRAQAPSPAVSPARRLLSVAPSTTPRLCFCEFWTCPQCSSVPAVVSALGGEEGAGEECSALHGQRRGGDSSRWGCLWGTHWANKSLLRVRAERVSALRVLRFTHMVILRTLTQAGLLAHWVFSRRIPKPQRRPWSFLASHPAKQGPEEDSARPPGPRATPDQFLCWMKEGLNSFVDCVSLASAFPFLVFFFFSSCCSFLTFMLFVHFTFSLSLPTSECLLLLSVRVVSSSSLFGPF